MNDYFVIGIILVIILFLLLVSVTILGKRIEKLEQSQPITNQRFIDTIIIHHSGAENINASAQSMRDYHIKVSGWDDIGYHFVIRRNGSVEMGRKLSKIGAHKKNFNKNSIGICLSGNTATKEQLQTLEHLCENLIDTIPTIKHISRHHSQCPGPSVNVEELERRLLRVDVEGLAKTLLDKQKR